MLKHIYLHIICAIGLLLPLGASAANNNLLISKANLNKMNIVMGDTTLMHLEFVQPKNAAVQVGLEVKDSISSKAEIGDIVKLDTTDIGNNRLQINAAIIVQAYDSGEWHVNPVLLLGTDTIRYSTPLLLKVMPVQVDPKGDIKDFAPVLEPNRKMLDYVPQWVTDLWWLWVLIAAIGVLTFAYFKWWRKGKNPFKHEKKRLPPYEEAKERLQSLKAQQLWQNGREKDYYTALTDILREYIERRLGINAVEMTTSQIMESLRHNPETQMVNAQLNEILAIADFVKFAGQSPLADDNERSFMRAEQFVDATKPAPETDNNKEDKEVNKK